jgi:hypothetical protein
VPEADHAPRPVAGDPRLDPRDVVGDHATLQPPVLDQPPPALLKAPVAAARHRLGVGQTLGFERLLGLAQPGAAVALVAKAGRQLVAARVSQQLVLGSIDGGGLAEDLLGDLLIGARLAIRRAGGHLGAVERDHPELDQTGLRAQLQHADEQLAERGLVTDTEPRDRRMIRRRVGGDHAKRDILAAPPLDRPRRPHPDRVGVDQQRHHHRRQMRRATMPVLAIGGVKRRQIQLVDDLQHKPR